MKSVRVENGSFICDGQPLQIISGAIHYFRIVPGYWEDRLLRAKACGLNTIETYIPWNLHEPEKGRFCFDGIADVEQFIEIADRLGLSVIIRPGPFICAEWDFGGLPGWLLNEPDIQLRCMNDSYLSCVDAYFDVLLPKLRPLLATNGGPIIAIQVENEYGSYGNDHAYLQYIKQGLERRGMNVLLFTSDGPEDRMLHCGTLPEVYKTINFGSDWKHCVEVLSRYQKDMPLMCMEFWNGWFDHWGDTHITRAPNDAAEELHGMLAGNMSVNIYMMHGGTNFGFFNGANYDNKYQPTVTSYDYDAPISEEGDLTPKYEQFRKAIMETTGVQPPLPPSPNPRKSYGRVELTQSCSLFSCLGKPVRSAVPLTMEACGQSQGFILYRTKVSGRWNHCPLMIDGLRDRALLFVNGVYQTSLYRNDPEQAVSLSFPEENNTLDILVENMGHINYGPYIGEKKGILGYISLECQKLFDWEIYSLPLMTVDTLPFSSDTVSGPAFHRGNFMVNEVCDTYFSIEGWHKGVVYINGFNIGRYWDVGPQKTLYIPAPLLRQGENQIVVFELYDTEQMAAELVDHRDLGVLSSDSFPDAVT